jgi:hypothetical protein
MVSEGELDKLEEDDAGKLSQATDDVEEDI